MRPSDFCPTCGGDTFECNGAHYSPDGYHQECNRPDLVDPEPITLTYMPRTGRSGAAVGWLLLGLAVGIMAGGTCFL